MNIVWVAHDHGLNAGAELCLWESVRGLVASDHRIHVIVPAPGKLAARLGENGVAVSVIPYRWWMHSGFRVPFHQLRRHLRAAAEIAALLEKLQPDVVITNTLTVPAGALAARRARIPHIWYIHEFGREDHGLRFDFGSSWSMSFVRRYSRRVMVNSLAVRRKFMRYIPDNRLRVLYYAVDVPSRVIPGPIPEEPFRLILTGRICAGKQQEDAVRGVAWLAENGIPARLTLLGNENLEYGKYLRALAHRLKVTGQIEFLPFTEDPFTHMAQAHVALVCSRREAFGRVTIEAMKQGKAVIGADAGGTSELIRDGVTGLLYRPQDAADLGGKIATLYRNRQLLEEMGKNARGWSLRTFNLQSHTAALADILKEAAASPL